MANSYHSWRTGIQIDNIYPIGSIYMSISPTNPGSLFGGTWEAIEDTFLLCAGTTYPASTTGGNAVMAHTHSQVATTSGGPSNNTSGSTAISINQMPSHNHTQNSHRHTLVANWSDGTGSSSAYMYSSNRGTQTRYTDYQAPGINNTGGGQGHTHTLSDHTHSTAATTTGGASNTDNMPPYLAVYVWKRIS